MRILTPNMLIFACQFVLTPCKFVAISRNQIKKDMKR